MLGLPRNNLGDAGGSSEKSPQPMERFVSTALENIGISAGERKLTGIGWTPGPQRPLKAIIAPS
jgi:hypothetical protein